MRARFGSWGETCPYPPDCCPREAHSFFSRETESVLLSWDKTGKQFNMERKHALEIVKAVVPVFTTVRVFVLCTSDRSLTSCKPNEAGWAGRPSCAPSEPNTSSRLGHDEARMAPNSAWVPAGLCQPARDISTDKKQSPGLFFPRTVYRVVASERKFSSDVTRN